MFTISTFKNLVVRARRSIKLIVLLIIATLIITCVFFFMYRPIYTVTLNGEFIGYSSNITKLQSRINAYMENGDEEKNIAFVQIENLPEYEICLLKNNIVTNDDEIFEIVTNTGTTYYEYYALTVDDEEKEYIESYDAAKEVIDTLKEKKSNNIDKLGMVKKYSTELEDFVATEDAVTDLYEKPPVVVTQTRTSSSSGTYTYRSGVNLSGQRAEIGISFIRPISGIITSRFGYRNSGLHTGLDIGAPTGTAIQAAADGVVTYAGWSTTGYGNYIIITHEDGTQTLYAHCSALYMTAGDEVVQGETIAAVGSTGNSTGPHLHFEIRVDGVCQNPQLYLY